MRFTPINPHTCNGAFYLWQVTNWVLEMASNCTVFKLACYPTDRPVPWNALALALANNRNLAVLDLSRPSTHPTSIGRKEINTLATALTGHPNMHTLILSQQSGVMGDEYSTILSGLASLLAVTPALTTLIADGMTMGLDNIVSIAQFSMGLETLNLAMNDLQNDAAPAIAALMARSTTLRHLSLSHNSLGGHFIIVIADALSRNTTLAELDLGYNRLTQHCNKRWADILAANTGLTSLQLQGNPRSNGIHHVIEALRANTTLRELGIADLPSPLHTNYHLMLRALAQCEHLKSLDWSGCKIGSRESSLVNAIICSGITTLALRNCSLDDLAGERLAYAIQHDCILVCIDLSGNEFPLTAGALLNALGTNASIRKAAFDSCAFDTHEACSALVLLLSRNATLTDLSVLGNSFGCLGVVEAITDAIELNNTTLQRLSMERDLSPARVYSVLNAYLARNREVHRATPMWARCASTTSPNAFKRAVATILMAAKHFSPQLPYDLWDLGIITYLTHTDFGYAPISQAMLDESTRCDHVGHNPTHNCVINRASCQVVPP